MGHEEFSVYSGLIPICDLKAQYRGIRDEIREAVDRVLDSSQYILGSEVAAFEEEFAAYSGAPFGVALNSGTSALHLALLAAGVGPGDEVITVPYTFVATTAAIGYTGARTRYVDIDPVSYTMNPAKIEAAITARTKAIVPVHLYGQSADMDPILEIARRNKLTVIEDAAQAHGAEYNGRRCGSMGDIGCFSFYPGKNLGAYGEGGMAVTSNPEYHRTMRMLRDWGQDRKYHYALKGYNYRMDGIQGAILRVKLRYLEGWTEARRTHAARYDERLATSGVKTPAVMAYARHVFHVYAIWAERRDELHNSLGAQGIQTGIHYPIPTHLAEAHLDLGYRRGDFPCSEHMAEGALSLPMYPEMSEEAIDQVAAAVLRHSRECYHTSTE